MKIITKVSDVEDREVRVRIEPTALGDGMYVSMKILVKTLAVQARRSIGVDWKIEKIEVYGERVTQDGVQLGAASRSYHRRTGYVYSLDDAPAWVHELATEALR